MSKLLDNSALLASLHLVAARKAGAEALVTLDERDSRAIMRPGDPAIREP